MPDLIRWPRAQLLAWLDEAQARGSLTLTLKSPADASSLRFALYRKRDGHPMRISVRGKALTIQTARTPLVEML